MITLAEEIAVELAGRLRSQGAVGWLPGTLFYAASGRLYSGRLEEARRTVAEALQLARDTGQERWIDQLVETAGHLAAIAGDEDEVRRLADTVRITAADPMWTAPWPNWALGLLDLGLGRVDSALDRLSALAEGRRSFHILATRSTPDLVEAAVRVGRPDAAAEALELYERWAGHVEQPWAKAMVHRCRALLADDADAARHYQAALETRTPESRPSPVPAPR